MVASRSRWGAIGAAVAVSFGAGGFGIASATIGSGERAVFVPITPCRLMDTRVAPDTVGPRTSPLGPADTYSVPVVGANGLCNLPPDATSIVMNVTAVAPTAGSFLTVFPTGVSRPLASNLNYVASQAPTPNAVTVDVPANGQVSFYNQAGFVNIVADIVGYYADHNHDDRYYTKEQVDAALNGAATLYETTTAADSPVGDAPIMSLSALPRGTYLMTYSLTVTNDTPGVGEVVRCTLTGGDGASTPAAPRAVRLENPGTNIGTLAGQAKATFQPFGSHHGVVYLFCHGGATFSVDAGATLTAIPVT
jgi:hypothetical protein